MTFDVPKLHKWTQNIENTLTEWATETVEEYYGIEDVSELTAEQIKEIQEFVDRSTEPWYSYTMIGFMNIINMWEDSNEYD